MFGLFGSGMKAKAEKIVEEDLGYHVSSMFRNRFNHIVREGESSGKNEFSIAIDFILYICEHLERTWSEKTGKVQNEEVINKIKGLCENIESISNQSNNSENESKERIKELLNKI